MSPVVDEPDKPRNLGRCPCGKPIVSTEPGTGRRIVYVCADEHRVTRPIADDEASDD